MNKPVQIEQVYFPDISEIYKQSIISAENYFDECILISIKTANSFEQIEKMSFWKFCNLGKSLNKYIEAENKRENGNGGENPDVSKEHSNMMNKSKNMMNSIKTPKFKK